MITKKSDRSEYWKEYRAKTEDKTRKERQRRYRANNKGKVIRKYPFRVWDAEGRNFPDGSHRIILLANTDGEYIEDEAGLSTYDCLKFLLQPRYRAIDCWYAFGYDVTQILKDIPLGDRGDSDFPDCQTLARLWETGQLRFKGCSIKYAPSKFFKVRTHTAKFRSFDTFGFFQSSFLKACEDWNIDASEIYKGKQDRNIFATWSLQEIREYNHKEMLLLKELLEMLRDSLEKAKLVPHSWHGPGAIAQVWLQKENAKQYYPTAVPQEMIDPIARGYFGGRIDISAFGEHEVYRQDINSAYPAAMAHCIDLSNVIWNLTNNPGANCEYALYHVRWKLDTTFNSLWNPFPWRTNNGTILYPSSTRTEEYLEGWYWGVEILAAERLFPGKIERIEAWYPSEYDYMPFAESILRDYKQRKTFQKENNSAERALKLALNSLYGKTAQHRILNEDSPRWQNFIWAGFITAYTRAKILDAIGEIGAENLVAVMTDGLLTKVPLRENVGKGLGQWEQKGKVKCLIAGPGLYAFFEDGKCTTTKQRGFPREVNFGYVLRKWGCTTSLNTPGPDTDTVPITYYVGIGKALHSERENFARFITTDRRLRNLPIIGTSKRQGHLDKFVPELQIVNPICWKRLLMLPRNPRTNETDDSPMSRLYKYLPEYKEEIHE